MKTLKLFLLSLLCAAAWPTLAAELPAASRTEINALLDRLGGSGCQFNRNGSWYNSADAKAHLTKKLDYLVGKKKVDNTEQFIALAASGSSMSGKDYLVRCGASPAVPSAVWLKGELNTMRAKARN